MDCVLDVHEVRIDERRMPPKKEDVAGLVVKQGFALLRKVILFQHKVILSASAKSNDRFFATRIAVTYICAKAVVVVLNRKGYKTTYLPYKV